MNLLEVSSFYVNILIYIATLISDGFPSPTLYFKSSVNIKFLTDRVGMSRHHMNEQASDYAIFTVCKVKYQTPPPPTEHVLMGPQNSQCGILHRL